MAIEVNYTAGVGHTVTGAQAAKMLGCDPCTIRRYRKAFGLKAPDVRKVMNKYVYTVKAVNYLAFQTGRCVKGVGDVC